MRSKIPRDQLVDLDIALPASIMCVLPGGLKVCCSHKGGSSVRCTAGYRFLSLHQPLVVLLYLQADVLWRQQVAVLRHQQVTVLRNEQVVVLRHLQVAVLLYPVTESTYQSCRTSNRFITHHSVSLFCPIIPLSAVIS